MSGYDGSLQAHIGVNYNRDLVYAHYKVQFSNHEYSLCLYSLFPQFSPQNTVYVPRVQFMSPEYSLCPKGTVCAPLVQFMYSEYSFCLQSTV